MYKVRLTKMNSTHQNLRSDVIEGLTNFEAPVQGAPFTMAAEALDPIIRRQGGVRNIITSDVKKWRHPKDKNGKKEYNKYELATLNSLYLLEYLPEEEKTNE